MSVHRTISYKNELRYSSGYGYITMT